MAENPYQSPAAEQAKVKRPDKSRLQKLLLSYYEMSFEFLLLSVVMAVIGILLRYVAIYGLADVGEFILFLATLMIPVFNFVGLLLGLPLFVMQRVTLKSLLIHAGCFAGMFYWVMLWWNWLSESISR